MLAVPHDWFPHVKTQPNSCKVCTVHNSPNHFFFIESCSTFQQQGSVIKRYTVRHGHIFFLCDLGTSTCALENVEWVIDDRRHGTEHHTYLQRELSVTVHSPRIVDTAVRSTHFFTDLDHVAVFTYHASSCAAVHPFSHLAARPPVRTRRNKTRTTGQSKRVISECSAHYETNDVFMNKR